MSAKVAGLQRKDVVLDKEDADGAKTKYTVVIRVGWNSISSLRPQNLRRRRKKQRQMSLVICARRRDQALLIAW